MNWGELSRAACSAAYDNINAVTNSATLNAARAQASAEFRAAHPGHLDLRYGPSERNTWDLYPASNPDAPCLIFIHGGYWQRNSKEQFANLMAGPRALGWSAALPGHTLAPDASLTEIAAEINIALDWLATNGRSHGIRGPAVLSGWSAGGHLTALCLGHSLIQAGIAISGIFELGPLRDTDLNEKLQLTEVEVETLSPLRLPMINKPLAIAYGTAELPALIADSLNLHARRAAAHLPGSLIPVPGGNHFTIVHELRDDDGVLTRHLPTLLTR